MTNRIFLDTEFYENGRTIELISIGLVKENGETYYAETPNARMLAQQTMWLWDNVLGGLSRTSDPKTRSHRQISNDIVEFAGEDPEFWAWYGSYDWVVLCQLYGRMIDLPQGWPMYIRDFKQTCDEQGMATIPLDSEDEHNALTDARWLRDQFNMLMPISKTYKKYAALPVNSQETHS